MPIKVHITILIAVVIAAVAITADAKQSRGQPGLSQVLDANGNLAEYGRL